MNAQPLQRVLAVVREWPGVTEATSRLGGKGAALFANGREFLHVHTATRIDVRVTKKHAKSLRGDLRVVSRPKPSDWVEAIVDDAQGVEFAIGVARIAWQEARRTSR